MSSKAAEERSAVFREERSLPVGDEWAPVAQEVANDDASAGSGSESVFSDVSASGHAGILRPVPPTEYRAACARFAAGITIVTCRDADGRPHGMTVTSFTSISLEPPLVLVSIDLRHAILGHFLACPWFAVNVLAENQERLSHRFSSVSENRFIDVDWHSGASGMPLLEGALAHFECAAIRHIEIGDHAVLIGEVRRVAHCEGRPLVYFNRSYRILGRTEAGGGEI